VKIGKFNSTNMRDLNNGYYLAYATLRMQLQYDNTKVRYASNISISAYDLQLEKEHLHFITGSVGAGNLKIPIPAEIKTFPFSATVKLKTY
jgi:hypothetical protein